MIVAVCVITYQRPEGLKRLLSGLNQLTFKKVQLPKIKVIVIDNNPNGLACLLCESIAQDFQWKLECSIEPKRGIPCARNKAISCAGDANFIIFIDDDEVPSSEWLDELLSVQQKYKAEVVSGPVLPYFKEQVPDWMHQGKFFERNRFPTGYRLEYASTNNVLIAVEVVKGMNRLFDERLALTGGSDTHFFMRVHRSGYKIIWADDAIVYEWIPQSKANAKWLLQRAYRTHNSFTLCRLEFEPTASARIARIVKGIGRIAQGVLLIPVSIFAGRQAFIRALQHICGGAGTLVGVAGKRYEEYRIVHPV